MNSEIRNAVIDSIAGGGGFEAVCLDGGNIAIVTIHAVDNGIIGREICEIRRSFEHGREFVTRFNWPSAANGGVGKIAALQLANAIHVAIAIAVVLESAFK